MTPPPPPLQESASAPPAPSYVISGPLAPMGAALGAVAAPTPPRQLRVTRFNQTVADTTLPSVRFLVDGLIAEGTVGLFAGSSGLGKTPFLVQLGLCVAHGIPFLGKPVKQGRVLYIDAESHETQFRLYQHDLRRFLAIASPSADFLWHNPIVHSQGKDLALATKPRVEALVADHQPQLVILDCLRPLFPDAEKDSAAAADMWQWQRALSRAHNITFLTVHHPRKMGTDRGKIVRPSLQHQTEDWFQQVAGHSALINQADVRLGFDRESASDTARNHLVLAGFSKSTGPIDPIAVDRVVDDNLDPVGYQGAAARIQAGMSGQDRELHRQLPSLFRPRDLMRLMGLKSDGGSLHRKLDKFRQADLCVKVTNAEGRTTSYRKLTPPGFYDATPQGVAGQFDCPL